MFTKIDFVSYLLLGYLCRVFLSISFLPCCFILVLVLFSSCHRVLRSLFAQRIPSFPFPLRPTFSFPLSFPPSFSPPIFDFQLLLFTLPFPQFIFLPPGCSFFFLSVLFISSSCFLFLLFVYIPCFALLSSMALYFIFTGV